jgi:hypothetical protein
VLLNSCAVEEAQGAAPQQRAGIIFVFVAQGVELFYLMLDTFG